MLLTGGGGRGKATEEASPEGVGFKVLAHGERSKVDGLDEVRQQRALHAQNIPSRDLIAMCHGAAK